jgi:hypothetical protein
MKRLGVAGAAAFIVLLICSAGQAATSASIGFAFQAVGDPFTAAPSVYELYYWSGAYAEATDDGVSSVFDDEYDPFGDPWGNVSSITAHAAASGAFGTATTQSGLGGFVAVAQILPGQVFAAGYSDLEHWIDFVSTDAPTTVGMTYTLHWQVETDAPGDVAWGVLDASIELQQWGDGDWYTVDRQSLTFGDVLTDPDAEEIDFADAVWFDPVGPGIYSIGIYGSAEASVSTTVPVPGALLLGAFGGGLVTWLRCRRSL